MRKKIALILALAMIMSLFQGVVFAKPIELLRQTGLILEELSVEKQDNAGVVIQKPQGIKYDTKSKRLQLVEGPGESEVALKWLIEGDEGRKFGTYELNYFIEDDYGKTKKVIAQFHVGKKNQDATGNPTEDAANFTEDPNGVVVQLKVLDSATGKVETLQYTKYNPPYGSGDGEVADGSSQKEVYTTFIDLRENQSAVNREGVVGVGNYFKFQFYYRERELMVSTTGIDKGLVVPFKLSYTTSSGQRMETEIAVFKGVKEFAITPTHLITTNDALGFTSQTVINQNIGEKAGVKPGVEVIVQKPKVIQGNQFVPIDQASLNTDGNSAQDTYGNLILSEVLSKNQGETPDVQLKVEFEIKNNADIMITNLDKPLKAGKVIDTGEHLKLYFSKDTTEVGKGIVVEWKELQAGMLIDGDLAFNGNYFNGPNPPHVVNSRVKPDKVGYTYVKYNAVRSGVNKISFNIEPYNINGPVTYTLMKESNQAGHWDAVDIRQYENKPTSETIVLTSHMGVGNEKYMIKMETGIKQGQFDSQILIYDAKNEPVPPPYTEILKFNNVYVIPNDDINNNPDPNAQTKPEAVGMDITWRAPSHEALLALLQNDNAIFYELNMGIEQKQVGDPIKVFKVYLDQASNQVKVELYAGTGMTKEGIYEQGRGSDPGTFTVRNIILKAKDSQPIPQDKWETIGMPAGYEENPTYPVASDIKEFPKDAVTDEEKAKGNYFIPDTFYFSMRGVYQNKDANKIGTSIYSNPKSLTLDAVHEVIPVPDGLKASSIVFEEGEKLFGGRIEFNYVDLRNYIERMLKPAGLYLTNPQDTTLTQAQKENRRTYEVFLYQHVSEDEGGKVPDFEDPTGEHGETVQVKDKNKVELTQAQREHLRETGNFIRLEYEDYYNLPDKDNNTIGDKIRFNVKGLDPNTVYYVQVRVRLDLWKALIDGSGYTDKLDPRYSILSKLASFTTTTKPLPPTPDEQTPPSPGKFFEVEPRPSETSVRLGWEPPVFSENTTGDVSYEIIRSESNEMKDEHQKKGLSLEEIIKQASTDAAYKYKYFNTEKPYIQVYENGWKDMEPKQDSGQFRLVDNSLLPNTVYYYYIRTVNKMDNEKSYSSWIMLPITTIPIQAPIHLMLESAKDYSYDTKREAVISFWAPIPQDSKVPNDYNFEVAIKGEKDNTYVTAGSGDYRARLIKEEPLEDKHYRKFVYEIKGLKHASRYDIKVRILDYTKNTSQPITSAYSDKITIRTEFSEDDQDKENAFEKYLEKYDKEAEKLKRKSYWEVEGGRYEKVYKYRSSYLKTDLGLESTYEFVSEDNPRNLVYYLPRDTFEIARKENTTVHITNGDYETFVRPGVLHKNEDIERAEHLMKRGKITDYYIRVELTLINLEGKIKGQKPVSPEILVDMEVIYLDEEDIKIEDEIMNELLYYIDKGRQSLVKGLEKEVKDDYIDEERLDELIEDEIRYVQEKHREEVEDILEDEIDDKRSINAIQKPMLILGKMADYHVEAYYISHGFEKVYTFSSMGGFAFEADRLGSYVFTGKGEGELVIPPVPGAQDLIMKYTFTDFFDLSDQGLEAYIMKQNLYGSIARMMGARRGTDYVQYLKQRGLDLISSNNLMQYVRMDEAIYTVMQAYEKMYYKPIGAITITNKQSVSNIGAFQPKYRQYVYAAVQLGVVKPSNQKVLPSKYITAEELIKMLTVIMPK